MEDILYSVLTARIIFNIRDVGARGPSHELHAAYNDHLQFALPLQRADYSIPSRLVFGNPDDGTMSPIHTANSSKVF
jgi:hypothetical protein